MVRVRLVGAVRSTTSELPPLTMVTVSGTLMLTSCPFEPLMVKWPGLYAADESQTSWLPTPRPQVRPAWVTVTVSVVATAPMTMVPKSTSVCFSSSSAFRILAFDVVD